MNRKHIYKGKEIRVDQYLVQLFPHISRAYLQQTIQNGYVLVNDKRCRKGTVIREGDEVDVQPFVQPNERTIDGNPSVHFSILHEFEHYVVLDKPPFLPTHPNQFNDNNTLANGLVAKFPQMIGVGDDPLRPGIVHRLDSNTSGVMLAALTSEGFANLRNLFNEREIHKTYVALVLGNIQSSGSIDTDVAHHPKNPRKMVALTSESIIFRSRRRIAKTLYEPIEQFGNYTLVRVKTLTGRMHQVRVHLASVGHPLVGDGLYQSDREKNSDKLGLTRHFLHAVSIDFDDPWTDQPQRFHSKLSSDLEYVLADLRN
jgi:23S rRNA pseudouridine1911/1915/1917 synthase